MNTASICRRLALLLALSAAASAQVTTRVSLSSAGGEGNWASYSPSISARGQFVVFESQASNLVPLDTNWVYDVFLRDRRTGTTTRISVDTNGVQANGDSYGASISLDGRFVTFYSSASNLVPGDTNGVSDIFVHDITTSTTTRVSVDSAGGEANGQSYYSSISATGRYVVFGSHASNLVAGDTNAWSDIFLHDRSSGITSRVSLDSSGAQANNRSEYPEISAAGRRVVFESWASNFVASDTNGSPDVFVRDLLSGTTVCASIDPSGIPGNGGCSYPSISGDGRVVGFASGASNLVAGDTNQLFDAFVHVLATGVTTRISVSTGGVESNALSQFHSPGSLSFDGRLVVFKSPANNLVLNDTNGEQDIFLRDCILGTTTRVNVDSQGAQAQGRSSQPVISADGRFVGFYSFAANLVPGDTNGEPDVFLRRL
jgi:hypothetical protein